MNLDFVQTLREAIFANPLLARLFMTSIELIVLFAIVEAVIRLGRIRAPCVRALLWLVVLAKPVLGLVIGTPLPVVSFNLREKPAESGREDQPAIHVRPDGSLYLAPDVSSNPD